MALNQTEQGLLEACEEAQAHLEDLVDTLREMESTESRDEKADAKETLEMNAGDALAAFEDLVKRLGKVG